jgi:hypothetical protein
MTVAKGAMANRALSAIAVVSVCTDAAFATPSVANDYSIGSVETDMRATDKVGRLKAGMLCLPKGILHWRDVAKPTDRTTVGILSRQLSALGLSAPDLADPIFSDAAPNTRYRIRIVYESLVLKFCAPSLGIGTPSGSGIILIRWETFDSMTKTLVGSHSFQTSVKISGRDIREDPAIIGDALRSSADEYVAARKTFDVIH